MLKIINLIPFERPSNYKMNRLQDVTIIIKTLERKLQLMNQLKSIEALKFKGQIIVADDSLQPYGDEVVKKFPKLNIKYIELPFDTGTSKGRNIMLEKVETQYFILCDDDFIFEPRTRIPLMKKYLIENELDLLGGFFYEFWGESKWQNRLLKASIFLFKHKIVLPPFFTYFYNGDFIVQDNKCKVEEILINENLVSCDITHNFFIAKTNSIKNIGGWNELLKGGEHHNFFLRAKRGGLKIGATNKCGVIHDRAMTPIANEYKKLRERDSDYQKIALEEFGLVEFQHYNGANYKVEN
jgi:glycosyltransferase involved in cell wall biosynthesis